MTDYGPLRLHVPEPDVRPGGAPDFSSVRVPRAGSVARPEVDADPEAMRDLAYSIIRVLNRDGQAVGPWADLLSDDELRAGLRDIMILRAFDTRMQMAQRQGKTSFYTCSTWAKRLSVAPFARVLLPGDIGLRDGLSLLEQAARCRSLVADQTDGDTKVTLLVLRHRFRRGGPSPPLAGPPGFAAPASLAVLPLLSFFLVDKAGLLAVSALSFGDFRMGLLVSLLLVSLWNRILGSHLVVCHLRLLFQVCVGLRPFFQNAIAKAYAGRRVRN
jgi:hypothetical protein